MAKVPKMGATFRRPAAGIYKPPGERKDAKSQAMMFVGGKKKLEPGQAYIVEMPEGKDPVARAIPVSKSLLPDDLPVTGRAFRIPIVKAIKTKAGWSQSLSRREQRELREAKQPSVPAESLGASSASPKKIAPNNLDPKTYQLALEIFGSDEEIVEWLDTPNVFLGQQRPSAVLLTEDGPGLVLNYLSKIESGTYV